MKNRFFPLLLALALVLSFPVRALAPEDFQNARLSGMTETADGALLVTDTYNKVVWQIKDGEAAPFAGAVSAADLSGEPAGAYLDAAADKAYFTEPWDVAPFLEGYVVSDAGANTLRYVANGRVQTLSGTNGKAGGANGAAKSATFDRPTGLAVGSDGALYIADAGSGAIRRMDKSGRVTTVAKGLAEPTGLCWYDGALYIAETGRSRICRIVNGAVQTFAGVSDAAEDAGEYYGGYVDGSAAAARFDRPMGVAAGADGTIYVSDAGNSAVRAIRGGRVWTIARGEADKLTLASPGKLLAQGDRLLVIDRFAGGVQTLSLAKKAYADVADGAWYAAAVETATRYGIASGVSDDAFAPDGAMNRAMFVTMLSRVHRLGDGSAVIDGDASFPDVPADAWYAAGVRWAADNAVVMGDDSGFAPLRNISRQELAVMLYRYAKTQGLDAAASDGAFRAFPDAGDAADWAAEALSWACAKGVLHGDDAGLLTPAASATRAQALTMLLNFLDAYGL